MSRTGGQSSTPRAVIHKRILDTAESNPNASMEEIADEIGGASTELVERVLDQYGDPAGDEQGSTDPTEEQESPDDTETADGQTMDDQDTQESQGEFESTRDASEADVHTDENGRGVEAYSDLTDRQVETLRLVEERPDASQADLADEFDVTRATISRWLNDIPGFEWTNRQEHATEILNGGEVRESDERDDLGGTDRSTGSVDPDRELDELRQRVDAIERQLDGRDARSETETNSGAIDPELAHKVVHASMQSERITEAEELQLLKELMASGTHA